MNGEERLPGQRSQARICRECRASYFVPDLGESGYAYISPPHDYGRGREEYCLACWLGVGPTGQLQTDRSTDAGLRK